MVECAPSVHARACGVAVGSATRVEPEHAGGAGRGHEATDGLGHGDAVDGDGGPVGGVAVDGAGGREHGGVAGDGHRGVQGVRVHTHLLDLSGAACCVDASTEMATVVGMGEAHAAPDRLARGPT